VVVVGDQVLLHLDINFFNKKLLGGGGGGGPRRPIGRLNTDGPSSMPSCPMGGCCR
jgi:hypothetical protein